MNWKQILYVQGLVLMIMSFFMIFPMLFSIYYHSNDLFDLIYGALISFFVGLFLFYFCKTENSLTSKESFVSVSLVWIFVSIFGALPLYFNGAFGSFINCNFEIMSGFTTTGATILTNIEVIPKGLLFWRSLTHWLGGMGIVLLTIAVLPMFNNNVYQLFSAEVAGPMKSRFTPKIKNTALILWLIYCSLTVLQVILLMLGGISLYDSLIHTFGTLGTGGFSNYNNSVLGLHSLYAEIIITIFMYLSGINFLLYFYLFKGKISNFFNDPEWKFYTKIILLSIFLVTLNIYFLGGNNYNHNFWKSLKDASFEVVSIITTTGFINANYNLWPSFSVAILIILMFFGGSAGSTAGGLKQIRVMVLIKKAINEVKKMSHIANIFSSVKVGSDVIKESLLKNITGFFLLFLLFLTASFLFLTGMGYDMETSFGASIATLANVGPGIGNVGAIDNYNFFDPISKLELTFMMLLGRLEIYGVIIMLFAFYSKKI